jgi:hypothetical protein
VARKSAQELLRKKKEAKQKVLLIALAPVFLGLLAWQGPKTYTAFTAGSAAPPVAPAPTTTAPTTGATPTPPAVPSGGQPASETGLPESDPTPQAGEGQLISFSRFVGKDPFRGDPATRTETPSGGTTPPPPPADAPAGTSASIEVNGTAQDVEVGDKFPAGDPVFRVAEINAQSAVIALVSGEFSNGKKTITINVGETLVLLSEPDGKRYAIKLISVA